MLKIENEEPRRWQLRKDIDEPIKELSSTDSVEPRRLKPNIENVDPMRATDRNDNEEPIMVKSNTDNAEPNRQ